MRILITTSIFPPDIGGPATYVPQVALALADRGHEITVATLSDRLDLDDSLYPFRVVRLPRRILKPRRWLYTVARLIQLGREAEVMFVNGLTLEAVLTNYWLHKPVVQKVVGDLAWEQGTNRGWVTDSFETFQQKRYSLKLESLKLLRAWWTRKADRVIVPSQYLARWVQEWGIPEGKIVVIYNALEPLHGVGPLEVPLQTPIKIVTVGRLVAWKSVGKLIEAIMKLDDVGLVIIGDGPERGRLERLARALGMAERVYFAGQRGKREALALMASCDLFVLNSTYEGLPHVVLEAMRLGLPVVATAAGGTPEVVQDGENGRLIPPLQDRALRDVLMKLLTSPAERQRLAEGTKRVPERFSLAHASGATEQVLFDVLRRA